MKFFVFFIVLLISAASVMLGVDWLQAPMSPMPTTHFELRAARPPAPPVVQQAAPAVVTPAAAATAAPATPAPAPTPTPVAAAPVTPAPVLDVPEPAPLLAPEPQPAAAAPAPQCDVAACERAFRSFTASDCTYQPSEGPRRLCTRGTPPSSPRSDVRAQAACNIAACSNAYISFNAGDCTYQPSDGPRRICDKQ